MPHDMDKVLKAAARVRETRMKLWADFVAQDEQLAEVQDQLVKAFVGGKPDASKMTSLHLLLRDDKSTISKAAEKMDDELKTDMADIEAALLRVLLENKAKSMNAGPATFYKEEVMKPSCTDWPAFYAFIKDNDAFEALEKRVTKAFIAEYIAENGEELPPGIAVHRETVVRVRRGKEG